MTKTLLSWISFRGTRGEGRGAREERWSFLAPRPSPLVPLLGLLLGLAGAGLSRVAGSDPGFMPINCGGCPLPVPSCIGIPVLPPTVYGTPGPREPPVPVVAISVHVPAHAAVGQELDYRITVANRSAAAAHHVVVRDRLPANARLVRADPEPAAGEPELLWQLGTLEAGASRDITLVLMPTGQGDITNCARVQFEHGQCVTTRIARPGLSLRKEGPSEAVVNERLIYRLIVTNTGPVDVTSIRLSDSLATGLEHASGHNALTWELGTLRPGQSRSVEYQVTARKPGKLCNRAAVVADGGLREVAENCITVTEAKLSLTVTGPASLYVNAAATYQLTVTNSGTTPLRQVHLAVPLPAQTTFAHAGQGGSLVNGQVQWALGLLAPGASRTVDLVLRARSPGRICTEATASAERGLSVQARACTNFIGVAGLLLVVVDTDDPVAVGAETRYIINLRNQGTAPITNIRMEAQVPDQMAIVRVQGASDHRKEGQKITFQALNLAPRAEARYVVTVQAKAPGDVRFKVDLWADQLTAGVPVHEEESTTIYTDLPSRRQPAR